MTIRSAAILVFLFVQPLHSFAQTSPDHFVTLNLEDARKALIAPELDKAQIRNYCAAAVQSKKLDLVKLCFKGETGSIREFRCPVFACGISRRSVHLFVNLENIRV